MKKSDLPAPFIWGMPPQFTDWRANQAEACDLMLSPVPRFTMAVCPTGFGKSLTYMAAALISGRRTVILTSTKGLQTQLIREFGSIDGILEIKGRGNYPCRLNTKVNCDVGLCAFGVQCSFREEGGCTYYDLVRKAKSPDTRVLITNYSYWMAQNEYSTGLGNWDCLVLDEGHAAVDHVISHISVDFNRKGWEGKILGLDKSHPQSPIEWKRWAESRRPRIESEIEAARIDRKEKRLVQCNHIKAKLEKVEGVRPDWVWESDPYRVMVSPIWPAPFTEGTLFLGIPRVIITSATVVRKTADLLGVAPDELLVEEYPHSFPVEQRPLIHTPTVRMNYRNGETEKRIWMAKLDAIIGPRLRTKGIIHTTSYARRDTVLNRSKFAHHMVTHDRRSTEKVVRAFKRSTAPQILVSPSMVTGWDFPGDECHWQIILKVPYPDLRGTIIKARGAEDKDFINYQVMQNIIQATGRGCRSVDDYCETYLLDNNIVWYMDRNKHLMVDWFKDVYRIERRIPEPL
jgi:Rad3-related DNA helicase